MDALRTGNFEVALIANCRGVPNPLLDVQTFLPSYAAAYGYYQDQDELDLYEKMLRETDFAKQRDADARNSKNTSSMNRPTRSG